MRDICIVGVMNPRKITAVTATATLAFAGLTACGNTAEDPVEAVTETVASPVESAATDAVNTDSATADDATAAKTEASAPAAGAGAAGPDLPAAVTGYSDEARADMAEDGLTEADIEGVLAAALNGDAEVEWDDGIWEIEWQGIDIDINPGGVVLDADR